MQKLKFLGVLGLGVGLPVAAHAQVVNFHNAYNYAYGFNGGPDPGAPLYGSLVYHGQGAYSDPGHNVWNGFGGGFGSSFGFSPDSNNRTTAPALTSGGVSTAITLTVNYDGDNGGLYNSGTTLQGLPAFILSQAAIVNHGTPGTFALNNVPAGTYDLFLYGANNDNDRGAAFAMTVGGGTAVNGITSTINSDNGPNNATPSTVNFVLGQNYVEYIGVTPNSSGLISGTWDAVTNPFSGNTGEGDFNGLQLVNVTPVPEPATIGLGMGSLAYLLRRRRRSGYS